MILRELLENAPIWDVRGTRIVVIEGIAATIDQVKENYIYIYDDEKSKLSWEEANEEAKKRGAVVIAALIKFAPVYKDIIYIKTYNIRRFISTISKNFYKKPSQSLKITGITGSHGKSTICWLLKSIIRAAGKKMTTINETTCTIGDEEIPYQTMSSYIGPEEGKKAQLNTILLNELLKESNEKEVEAVSLECGFTDIANETLRHISFDSVIFTDLYSYYQNRESDFEYLEIRKNVLDSLRLLISPVIVNIDDYYSDQFRRGKLVGYSVFNHAHVSAKNIVMYPEKTDFTVITDNAKRDISTCLTGVHNVYNILAAVAWGLSYNYSIDTIIEGINNVEKEFIPMLPNPIRTDVEIIVDNELDCDYWAEEYKKYEGQVVSILCIGSKSDKEQIVKLSKILDPIASDLVITSDYNSHKGNNTFSKEIAGSMITTDVSIEMDHFKALRKAATLVSTGGKIIVHCLSKENEPNKVR